MEEIFRRYRDSDYDQCEGLVNQVWGFDKKALSDVAKCIYAKGAVLARIFHKKKAKPVIVR